MLEDGTQITAADWACAQAGRLRISLQVLRKALAFHVPAQWALQVFQTAVLKRPAANQEPPRTEEPAPADEDLFGHGRDGEESERRRSSEYELSEHGLSDLEPPAKRARSASAAPSTAGEVALPAPVG